MQSTPPAQPRQYGAAQARFIMKLADEYAGGFDFLEFRENAEVPGVFMSELYADVCPSGARGIEAGRLLAWNPAVDLENGPDPATWPLLPATFSARDLAAFLVYGVGTFIHDLLGADGVLDESALENVGGMRDEWVRQALREAYDLVGRARAAVGPLDDEAEREAGLLGRQLDDAIDQANKRERVFELGISDDEASARRDRARAAVACLEKEFEGLKAKAEEKRECWRRDMVRALLEGSDTRQDVEIVAAEQTGNPAESVCEKEAEPRVDGVLTHQGQAAEMTPRKRAAIIKSLGRRYPALESALNRPEEWAKACRVPKELSPDGKQGWYYLERIEDQCRARYGATAQAPVVDLSPAGQLHCTGK